jgi:hypothetical protein
MAGWISAVARTLSGRGDCVVRFDCLPCLFRAVTFRPIRHLCLCPCASCLSTFRRCQGWHSNRSGRPLTSSPVVRSLRPDRTGSPSSPHWPCSRARASNLLPFYHGPSFHNRSQLPHREAARYRTRIPDSKNGQSRKAFQGAYTPTTPGSCGAHVRRILNPPRVDGDALHPPSPPPLSSTALFDQPPNCPHLLCRTQTFPDRNPSPHINGLLRRLPSHVAPLPPRRLSVDW